MAFTTVPSPSHPDYLARLSQRNYEEFSQQVYHQLALTRDQMPVQARIEMHEESQKMDRLARKFFTFVFGGGGIASIVCGAVYAQPAFIGIGVVGVIVGIGLGVTVYIDCRDRKECCFASST